MLNQTGLSFVFLSLLLCVVGLVFRGTDPLRRVDVRVVTITPPLYTLLLLALAAVVYVVFPESLVKSFADGSLFECVPQSVLFGVQMVCMATFQVGYVGSLPLRTILRFLQPVIRMIRSAMVYLVIFVRLPSALYF